ncbi:MAG: SRPBCC family protein [Baekduiaceae bacterium]
MARYVATLDTEKPVDEVFAYLADFSTTEEWDPGVVSASRGEGGPLGVGSTFDLVASFLGRENALTYTVTEYEAPHAITLRGESATVVSLDRITTEPHEGGTRITYDADLSLKGPLRLFDPVLKLAFNRVGDRALEGLRGTLGAR